jgi:hypothetical protein
MNRRWVGLIRRAVESAEEWFPLKGGWEELHREYNIGLPSGNQLRLRAADKAELVALVRSATGLDLNAAPADFKTLSRGEALDHGHDEKWAGRAVAADRLLLKALPGGALRVNGGALRLPARAHLDLAAAALESMDHPALLVIENYECFDRIDRIRLALPKPWADPLVVYRGDPRASRADTVNALLAASGLPVLALADIDPAGLLIAASLPGVVGLLAPDGEVLEGLLAEGNPDLYRRQLPWAGPSLRAHSEPVIRRLWELLERHGKAVAQERWLRGDVAVRFYGWERDS